MEKLSKLQMIYYLRDYANIQCLAANNRNMNMPEAFFHYLNYNGRQHEWNLENFQSIYDTYISYLYFRGFSFVEDFLLNRDDFISNNDLDSLNQDGVTYEGVSLTNKKIIQLIRNAFNHNGDSDFDRFSMLDDSEHFQIQFKDIRTDKEKDSGVPVKPFKMIFGLDYLVRVVNIINKNKQNFLFIGFDIPNNFNINATNIRKELDKISLVHYYFNRKVPKEVLDEFGKILHSKELNKHEKSKKLNEIASTHGDKVFYPLTDDQKNIVATFINGYRAKCPNLLLGDVEPNMYYFLCRVIPIPLLKELIIMNQKFVALTCRETVDISLNDIVFDVFNMMSNNEHPIRVDNEIYDTLNIRDDTMKMNLYKDLHDNHFTKAFPFIMYLDAVVTHLCTDEEITIDNKTYSKELIRNSFVHGRWYISTNQELVMYDADPRNIKDYELNYIGSISINSFVKWADNYVNSYGNEKGPKLIKIM